MFSITMLSFLIFLPIIAVFIILTMRGDKGLINKNIKYITTLTSFIHFFLCLYLLFSFNKINYNYQFVELIPLMPSIEFSYYLGLDGISLIFLLLSSFLMLFVLATHKYDDENSKVYAVSMLLILSGATGTFVSLDILLFYVFYEVSIIPVFFLMGIFGNGNKFYATFKFFLYTVLGSIFMIVSIITMIYLAQSSSISVLNNFVFKEEYQLFLFIGLFIAFAVKSAVFPFHTWLPDTYNSSSMSTNILLSGILMKYGVYGFIKFVLPIFPVIIGEYLWVIYTLSLISLIYAGVIAVTQDNIVKLFSYLSISHMGLIVAGLFSGTYQGLEGAIYQSVSHSIFMAGIFFSFLLLQNRLHSNSLKDFRGLANVMPLFATSFMVLSLAAIAFPLTNSFIGEILLLLGIFQNNRIFAVLFSFSVLISACVVVIFNAKFLFGKSSEYVKHFKELSWGELFPLVIISLLVIAMGVYPDMFLDIIHTTVNNILEQFNNGLVIKDGIYEIHE